MKERHSWTWNEPGMGQRQCSKCGKVSTIRSHSTLGGCKSPTNEVFPACLGSGDYFFGCETCQGTGMGSPDKERCSGSTGVAPKAQVQFLTRQPCLVV